MDMPNGGVSSGTDSGSYMDLNRLKSLKTGDRDSDANMHKVAQEFESLFLGQMLKSMRSANEVLGKDDPMNSATTKQYQDMYDSQLSVNLSRAHGIGLQDVLMRQLTKNKGHVSADGQLNHNLPGNASNGNTVALKGNGLNPFAPSDPTQHLLGAAHASTPGNKTLAVADDGSQSLGRNDMSKMNLRRLSLPSKLTDRLLAGITPGGTLDGKKTDASGSALPSATQVAASPASTGTSEGLNGDWTSVYTAINGIGSSGAKTHGANNSTVAGAAPADGTRSVTQVPLAPGKKAFASAEEFVATMLPMAQEAAARIGVDPHVLVAQAALETGWGRSIMRSSDGTSSHNLFNIKATSSWNGGQARAVTSEFKDGQMVKETANFRAYNSFEDSFHDLVSLLQNNDRYQSVVKNADDPEQFVKELQKAGYATDPHYASKISQIAQQMKGIENYASTGASSHL